MLTRKTPLACPHCQKDLPFSTYSKYFYYGTAHVERCPHCEGAMKPEKEPVRTFLCYQIGTYVGVGTSLGYLFFVEDHLLHAMLFASFWGLLLLILTCYLTYVRIDFIRFVE